MHRMGEERRRKRKGGKWLSKIDGQMVSIFKSTKISILNLSQLGSNSQIAMFPQDAQAWTWTDKRAPSHELLLILDYLYK